MEDYEAVIAPTCVDRKQASIALKDVKERFLLNYNKEALYPPLAERCIHFPSKTSQQLREMMEMDTFSTQIGQVIEKGEYIEKWDNSQAYSEEVVG